MNFIKVSALVILFLSAFNSAGYCADEISISQSVDRFTMPYEDSVHFDIILKWNGPQSSYLFTSPLNPTYNGLKVRGFTSSISTTGSGDNETTTKRFRYTLIPVSPGEAYINPVTVPYISWPDSIPGELVTEAMTIQVAQPELSGDQEKRKLSWVVTVSYTHLTLPTN